MDQLPILGKRECIILLHSTFDFAIWKGLPLLVPYLGCLILHLVVEFPGSSI